MKKIFAFILASIMVLSLVPASAFAAVVKCPKTHTVAVCDALGISYSQVGNPVAPDCLNAGYTVYECDKCGVQFLGNFTDKAGHTPKSDPKKAHLDVKADCTKGNETGNGISYVVCTVCGEDYSIEVKWNHKDSHKLTVVAGSGIGCVTRYRCSVCGEEGYLDADGILTPNAAHDWEFTSVKAEPSIADGVLTNGIAVYTCEVCKDTKEVEILSVCKHYDLENNLVVDASEPTCDKNGSRAVFQCPDCLGLFEYSATEIVELGDYNKDGVKDIADSVIPALGHTYDVNTGVKEGCEITYVCEECELTFTEESHSETSIPYGDTVGMASCISKLYTPYLCDVCATVWVDEDGETDPTHETESYIKPSTCNVFGYKGEYCLTCGELTADDIADNNLVLGYDYWRVVVDPDGANEVHYYPIVARTRLAKNPNAHNLVDTKSGTPIDELYISCTGSDTIRYITCNDCEDYGYELYTQKKAAHTKSIKLGTINHYADAYLYVTIPSYTFMYKGLPHTVNETNIRIGKKKSADVYYCEVCNNAHVVETAQGKVKTTTFYASKAAVLEEYNCFKMLVLPIDGTLNSTGFEIQEGKYIDVVRTSAYADTDNVVWSTVVAAPNCSAKGYIKFEAKTEGSGARYAYITSNQHTRATNAKWVKGYMSTCEKEGSFGYYVCSKCNAKFAYVGGDNTNTTIDVMGMYPTSEQKEFTSTSIIINKHVANVDLVEDVLICNITSYWMCYAEGCGATFADEDASIPFDPTADAHLWIYAKGYEGKAATCNQNGTLEIRTCANCDLVEFNALYEFGGETIRKNIYKGDIANAEVVLENEFAPMPVIKFTLTAGGKTATDMTVTKISGIVPMYEHKAPYADFAADGIVEGEDLRVYTEQVNADAADHSKAQFVQYECLGCSAELLTDYVPATGGHINAAGEILTTACDNASVKDRVCVLCAPGSNEISISHVESDPINVPATCIAAGYTYWYCLTEGCGFRHVENDNGEFSIDENAHDYQTAVDIEANYAHDGQTLVVCALCGKTGTPTTQPAPNVAGVEISVYTEFDSYMPGSIVNVTVSLESLRGVDVWAARFGVKYDKDVYQFLGYSNVADEFASAYSVFKANPIIRNDYSKTPTVAEQIEHGYVSIIAQAEEDLYIKGSYDLVTLQFKVIATEIITEDSLYAQVYGVTDSSFTVSAETVEYKTYKTWNTLQNSAVYDTVVVNYPIEVVNSKAKKVQAMFGDGENSVAPALEIYLDLDADGAITLADAKYIYAMITDPDAEYNVLADADGDGYVTPADLAILYDIFTGATTLKEVLFPEEESDNGEKLNQLGARKITTDPSTGKIIYDSYCDFNMNGIIDSNLASEMAALTGAIDYRQMWASMGYDVSNLY